MLHVLGHRVGFTLSGAGLDDDRFVFVEGLFGETLCYVGGVEGYLLNLFQPLFGDGVVGLSLFYEGSFGPTLSQQPNQVVDVKAGGAALPYLLVFGFVVVGGWLAPLGPDLFQVVLLQNPGDQEPVGKLVW